MTVGMEIKEYWRVQQILCWVRHVDWVMKASGGRLADNAPVPTHENAESILATIMSGPSLDECGRYLFWSVPEHPPDDSESEPYWIPKIAV